MKKIIILIMFNFLSLNTLASSSPSKHLSKLTCKKILTYSSSEWVDEYSNKVDGSTIGLTTAIDKYAQCYDKFLKNLQRQTNIRNRGPFMGANGNFQDMQIALRNFSKQAIKATTTGGTIDNINDAYANLYAKQFRFYFLQSYIDTSKLPTTNAEALTKAKTYFKESLNKLSINKRKLVNKAFNDFAKRAHHIGMPMIKVYEYGIELIQPLNEKPFSPPPF